MSKAFPADFRRRPFANLSGIWDGQGEVEILPDVAKKGGQYRGWPIAICKIAEIDNALENWWFRLEVICLRRVR